MDEFDAGEFCEFEDLLVSVEFAVEDRRDASARAEFEAVEAG